MKKKLGWLGLAVLIIVLAMALVLALRGRGQEAASERAGIVLDENARDWDGQLPQPDETDGIQIPGYSTVYFPQGEREVQLTLYNPKENDCLFFFSLYLDEEEEPIYTSNGVEPGKAVSDLTLTRGLEAGSYRLYIQIDTQDPDSGATLNGARVEAELVVQ